MRTRHTAGKPISVEIDISIVRGRNNSGECRDPRGVRGVYSHRARNVTAAGRAFHRICSAKARVDDNHPIFTFRSRVVDMQPGECDGSAIGEIDIENHRAAVDGSVRIAADFGSDPSGSSRVHVRDGWNLVPRNHIRLEVVRLLYKLCSDNAAGELGGVDVHVVVFGIFDQAPQGV